MQLLRTMRRGWAARVAFSGRARFRVGVALGSASEVDAPRPVAQPELSSALVKAKEAVGGEILR